MERALEEVAEKALITPTYRDLLDAVASRKVDLPTLLYHRNAGTLDELLRRLHDPLLKDAISRYEDSLGRSTDRSIRISGSKRSGIALLRRLAPARSRLSYLNGRTITALCKEAERPTEDCPGGRKRNSVHRSLLRAISQLLRQELGHAERDRIFKDVNYAPEDDTREVYLSASDIKKLLKACTDLDFGELRTVLRLAIQTSADRGVLLSGPRSDGPGRGRGLRVRHLRIYEEEGRYSGEVFLPDTKTQSRRRTVPLTDSLCRELLVLTKGKEADDFVFSMPYYSLDYPWKQVRKAAGLQHVRFKDLRAQTSIHGEKAGISLTTLQRTLGHADESMTRRYQARHAQMTGAEAEALEQELFGRTG